MTELSKAYLDALNGPKTVVGYPDLLAYEKRNTEYVKPEPLPTITRPEVSEIFKALDEKIAAANNPPPGTSS